MKHFRHMHIKIKQIVTKQKKTIINFSLRQDIATSVHLESEIGCPNGIPN